MASQERSIEEFDDEYDHEESENDFNGCGYSFDHQNPRIQSLSRLSLCKTTDEDYEWDHELNRSIASMSRLSVESFDADGELSDSSESDKEPHTCYSLPATPLRSKGWEFASERETRKGMIRRRKMRKIRFRKRRVSDYSFNEYSKSNSFSAESDQSGGGGSGSGSGSGLVVITRPKGGKRALCMDMEEVKACRDLGFELEHEKMSLSGSTAIDTSSGGDSPISNWRISSPGDDPRDVKARLKLWAQAVALVSASKNSGI